MIGSLFLTSLLYFVLLLSLCQVLCGQVYATNKSPPGVATTTSKSNNNIELFKTGSIEVNFNSTGTAEKKSCNVNNYYSPVVVSAGDVIVALTGVNRTSDNSNDNNNNNVTIVTKYIEIDMKKKDWGAEILTSSSGSDNGKWKSQFAVQHKLENIGAQTSIEKGMLAAANDKKIYLLLVNCSNKNNGDSTNDAKCDVNITVGTVTSETADKKITWDDGKLEKKNNIEDLLTKVKEGKQKVFPSGGTAFITADNKVVFVGLIANEKKKNAFVVIYSEGGEDETKFKVSKVENVDGCALSFFPWGENKIIMMPTHCSENGEKKQKVKESSDLGGNWSESTGPFARLLGFMQDKNNFTATKINNTNLLLFTQKKPKTAKGADTKNDAHVWFTDGNRVHSVGRIVTDHNITSASLLHTKGELFALHQNWDAKGQQKNITLTRMEEQLNEITTVITAWKNTDNVVTKLFKETFASSESLKATDGLVGFLSNNGESNKNWADEYYYVNATVTKGEKVNCGFTFKGKGKNAKWPVGKSTEDQPYNFTDPGFTLLANVTIDGGAGSGKDNSVMGVGYEESNKSQKTVGLLCTQGDEWKLTGNGVQLGKIVTNEKQCQRESTYFLAIVLNNSKLFVYIDGEVLGETGNEKIRIEKKYNITHFYFGADESQNDVESHVTVRNVLLYNRPFTEREVEKLKIPKERKVPESSNDSLNDTKTDDESNSEGGNETTKDGDGDEKSPSQSRRTAKVEEKSTSQPENSTVRNYVAVFVFFVMLAHALCFL